LKLLAFATDTRKSTTFCITLEFSDFKCSSSSRRSPRVLVGKRMNGMLFRHVLSLSRSLSEMFAIFVTHFKFFDFFEKPVNKSSMNFEESTILKNGNNAKICCW
jgi:hypothetical protein